MGPWLTELPVPQLSSTYGPIFTVWLGLKPVVVLCGYEAVKDALVGHSEEFGGRPEIPLLMQLSKDYGECLDPFWISLGEQTQDLQHPFPTFQDLSSAKPLVQGQY